MKTPYHALRVWVRMLWVFCLLPSSVYAQEAKDSIHGDIQHLNTVTVTARRDFGRHTSGCHGHGI